MHSSKRFQSVEPNDFHETTLVPSSSVRQMKMMMRNSLPKLTKKAQTYTYSREKRCSWKTNLSHTLSFFFILPIRPVGDAMATVKINTRNLVKISLAIHSSQIPVTARAMHFTLKIRVLILLIMKKRKQKQSNGKDGAGERERERASRSRDSSIWPRATVCAAAGVCCTLNPPHTRERCWEK